MLNHFEGAQETQKPSSKVLRPPGGGVSTDIFGAETPQTPRSVKNHMASNIFACETDSAVKNNGDGPRRAQKNADSYTRLFGEPDRPVTPARNNMKSSIPFGVKSEAAQQLLTNGNGHYNGKCGSVSSTSASSSVSSSTENLKINGVGFRSVFRSVNPQDQQQQQSPLKMSANEPVPEPESLSEPEPKPKPESEPEQLCVEHDSAALDRNSAAAPEYVRETAEAPSQTRRDAGAGSSTGGDNTLAAGLATGAGEPPTAGLPKCAELDNASRNPITGLGLNGDGVGGLKPRRLRLREGNPVTGEGYKPGATDFHQPAAVNGTNQVINKNRIPPGGYSSGLW